MARTVEVRVRYDPSAIDSMLSDASGASASRAARKVAHRARVRAPHDTGRLARSINARLVHRGAYTEYSVGTNVFYAPFQEYGVPHRIYPVRAKALRFKPKGFNVYIFRAYTRGVPATHFLRDAYRSITFRDFFP